MSETLSFTLNGKAERLGPGVRVRDVHNRVALSGSLRGQTFTVNYLRDPAGDFGTNLGISQDFERAERFLGGLEFARGDLGHGDLRGRWSGPRLLRGWFAAGGKKEGQKQSEEERGTHRGTFHGRSDSLANSSAMVSRRRIRCIRSPSIMTSAARGRVL